MDKPSPFSSMDYVDIGNILSSSPELGHALLEFEKDKSIKFCRGHASIDTASQSTWRLHAALLHLMLRSLVKQYYNACSVASIALGSRKSDTLELAFQGQARDSFVWLQCLFSEESSWCTAVGCPACSTMHVTFSDTTIRAVMTAALFSCTREADREMPNFLPVLGALESAVSSDSFWTPMHYPHLLAQARGVTRGFRDLNRQCSELEILISSPISSNNNSDDGSSDTNSSYSNYSTSSSSSSTSRTNGNSPLLLRRSPESLIPLKPSKLAKRQMALQTQEMEVMASMLRQWMILRTNDITPKTTRELLTRRV